MSEQQQPDPGDPISITRFPRNMAEAEAFIADLRARGERLALRLYEEQERCRRLEALLSGSERVILAEIHRLEAEVKRLKPCHTFSVRPMLEFPPEFFEEESGA